MIYRLQYRLAGLIFLVTLTACALGLGKWIGFGAAIPVMTLPFVLLGEQLLYVPPAEADYQGNARDPIRIFMIGICSLTTMVAAWQSISEGVPELLSPLPLLVILPGLCFLPLALATPVITFAILHADVTRRRAIEPIPLRSFVLLCLATLGSTFWLGAGWSCGLDYQGTRYTCGIIAVNLAFLAVLWLMWLTLRRDCPFNLRLTFGILLQYWLFWFAFPWLGELP